MKLYSNMLWVMQEITPFSIQLGARNRNGKLVYVYDLVSQFILCSQVCFLSNVNSNYVEIFGAMWRYGIPECIALPDSKCKNVRLRELEEILGIVCVDRNAADKKVKSLISCDILNEVGKFEQKCKESFCYIMKEKFDDLQELRGRIRRMILKWNNEKQSENGRYSPEEQYHQDIQHHIFLEKDTLAECCVMQCVEKVEDGTVRVLHRLYRVPKQFHGETLTFYVSRIQKDEIYILDKERRRVLYRCPLVGEAE